ncbi:MAG TPA: YihY/virulence factor BrkB family protein [Chthonomonadaceae bacterium]|nr:YihY/virulence factor BrkB family protein [Chthonomonadaceae bacterium]
MQGQSSKRRARLWRWSAKHARQRLTALSECTVRRHSNVLDRAFCYLHRLSDAYATHQCSFMASACAYSAVLSLVPLLVVGVALLGYIIGNSQRALDQVVAAINAYVPVDARFVREILANTIQGRGVIGLVGLLGLLYAAHLSFLAMEPAMNIIWVVPEKRHWLHQRLVALGATLYALVLLGADLGFSALFAYLQTRPEPFFTNRFTSITERVLVALIPMGLTTLLFALLYRLLPARTVPWRSAFLGASVAALLWQITKIGFTLFLAYVHSYDRLYGSLSGLVILVVWMYYSMVILLLGAEIAADYETTTRSSVAAEARAHSGADLFTASGASVRHPEVLSVGDSLPRTADLREQHRGDTTL